MPKHIEPKPTRYRGILYRSKLEARWAVFFDNLPNVLSFEYEPKHPRTHTPFTDPETGWTYTPDFRIQYFLEDKRKLLGFTGKKGQLYIEVKPTAPSQEYMTVLLRFSTQIPIALICGSFFDMELYSGLLAHNTGGDFAIADLCPNTDTMVRALKMAANYRFDLRQR